MHGLRSAILAGETGAAAAPPSTEEACRRQGPRDPSRAAPERARDERRVAAQRRARRHREIVEHATLLVAGKRCLVRVVNVSAGGLTLEAAIAPPVGETVRVEFDGAAPVEAVVRWVRKGRIGLDAGEGAIALTR
jgi:PilZ domain-containing protein